MRVFYEAAANRFWTDRTFDLETIPQELCAEMTQAQYEALLAQCVAHGGNYAAGADGWPVVVAPTLEDRRELAWERIKQHRNALSDEGGYKVSVDSVDKWFHSDPRSKTQQLGLVLAGAGIPAGLQWKTMDGTFVAMTQALAGQVYQAAMAQDAAIFQAAETHRAQMLAAPNPDAYDFSGGWPATFGG